LPSQRLRPALPPVTLPWSTLPTCPTVARQVSSTAHLARRETQRRVAAVLRDELDRRAGRARHLAALARLQLDVVHERAGRDVLERQRVAGLDVGAAPDCTNEPTRSPAGARMYDLKPSA
jgi:hypothetical protein